MSLQDLCIKAIVDKFEKYYIAFSKSIDPNVTRKFEFLQRVYSYEIASKLYESNKLRADYVDLLVNKYLKTLNTDWFKDCPWETVAAKFAEVGPNLQKITILEERPWLQVIHHLTNLEVLSFRRHCNDDILKCISQFSPNIVEIDVKYSFKVTDDGIQYLCRKENGKPLCPKLKILSIRPSNVTKEGVKYLIQNLRSLEETDYRNLHKVLYLLHKNYLSVLNKLEPYKLTSLNFLNLENRHPYSDILNVCLSVCPCLKTLFCPVFKEENLYVISHPLELEKLCLENFSYSDSQIDITGVLRMIGKRLTSLTVRELTFSVTSLSESCPYLKELYLNEVVLQNVDGVTPFFKHLETCIFDDYNTSYIIVATAKFIPLLLEYSPKLEYIGFRGSKVYYSEFKTIILRCGCLPIKRVDFTDSLMEMDFVKDVLLNFHSLKLLDLDKCTFDTFDGHELNRFAQSLPNNPEIKFSAEMNIDYTDDESLNSDFDSDNSDDNHVIDADEDFGDDSDDDFDDDDDSHVDMNYEDDYVVVL